MKWGRVKPEDVFVDKPVEPDAFIANGTAAHWELSRLDPATGLEVERGFEQTPRVPDQSPVASENLKYARLKEDGRCPIVTISRESYSQAKEIAEKAAREARLPVHFTRSPDRGFRRIQYSGNQTSSGHSRCSSRPGSIHVREGKIYRLYTGCPAAALPERTTSIYHGLAGHHLVEGSLPRSQGQDHRQT